jgi:cytochrome oxidase assembly protein ShyY1
MRFRQVLPKFFLITTALAVETGLLTLANWQSHRYHQRLSEQAAFDFLPNLTLTGTFDDTRTAALTNQPNPLNPEAETGWRILTPLTTSSGTILVDRGYMQPTFNPDGSPNFAPATATLEAVSGVLKPFPQRHGWLRGPDVTTHPRLLAFLNPSVIISETTPAYLIARTSTSPNLTSLAPPLPAAQRHLNYMLQWLGLAIAFPILCAVRWYKARRKGE